MWLIPGCRKGVSECERGRQMAEELKTMTERERERWEGRVGGHRRDALLGEIVLLPAFGRPQLLKARLHLFQDLRGVPYHQLHCPLSSLQQLHSFLMVLSFYTLKDMHFKSSIPVRQKK